MDAALKLGSAAEKTAALSALLKTHVGSRSREGVAALAALLGDEGKCPAPVIADVFRTLADLLEALPPGEDAFKDYCCVTVIDILRGRQLTVLDDVEVWLRSTQFDIRCLRGQPQEAASLLSGARIESAALSPSVKAYMWVRVVEAFMLSGSDALAENFMKKATDLHKHMEKTVHVQYTLAMAKLHDNKRNFLQAAIKFEDVSRRGKGQGYTDDDLSGFLACAVRCILLEKVGPARLRIMSALTRDVRISFIQVSPPPPFLLPPSS